MTTQTQWNSAVNWYDENMGEEGDALNATIIRPELLKILGDLNGKTVLDVGCGSGYLTTELAQTAKKVIGTDFAPDFVSLCTTKYADQGNVSFQQQDVTEQFPFFDNVFDVVISKMVLQYVPKIQTFVTESYRVLKPYGKLVVAVDHPFHTQFFYAQALVGKPNPKYEGIEDYFSSNPQTKLSLWGKVELTWYPRTVSDYIQPFLDAGFALHTMKELSETRKGVVVPRILLLKFEKQA